MTINWKWVVVISLLFKGFLQLEQVRSCALGRGKLKAKKMWLWAVIVTRSKPIILGVGTSIMGIPSGFWFYNNGASHECEDFSEGNFSRNML
jgi:hypothetical protein